jgi:hypothetical protein
VDVRELHDADATLAVPRDAMNVDGDSSATTRADARHGGGGTHDGERNGGSDGHEERLIVARAAARAFTDVSHHLQRCHSSS